MYINIYISPPDVKGDLEGVKRGLRITLIPHPPTPCTYLIRHNLGVIREMHYLRMSGGTCTHELIRRMLDFALANGSVRQRSRL